MNIFLLIMMILVISYLLTTMIVVAYLYDQKPEYHFEQTDLERRVIQIKNDLASAYLRVNR